MLSTVYCLLSTSSGGWHPPAKSRRPSGTIAMSEASFQIGSNVGIRSLRVIVVVPCVLCVPWFEFFNFLLFCLLSTVYCLLLPGVAPRLSALRILATPSMCCGGRDECLHRAGR